MLKRLLMLALLCAALLLMLGLMAAQAETAPAPLAAIAPVSAALPPENAGKAQTESASRLASTRAFYLPLLAPARASLPQEPEISSAYHIRCFSAFHYSDRAG